MKKQFNLQDWLKDKSQKVETRSGLPVRIICWDRRGERPLVVLIQHPNGYDEGLFYYENGLANGVGQESDSDLFLVTPEPEMTPLEELLSTYLKNDFEYFSTKKWDEKKWNEVMRTQAAELLNLAKKELCKGCNANLEGYIKGREEERKEMEYIYKGYAIPASWPPCHYGGECINPFRDCINCPQNSTVEINTLTGTSTKVEEKK